MAFLDRHPSTGVYRIRFRFAGREYFRSLKTRDRRDAENLLGRADETLRLLERGRLELPDGADVGVFILSDGKLNQKPTSEKPLTLAELFAAYAERFTSGAKEASTRKVERIHAAHVTRVLGPRAVLAQMTTGTIQGYVDTRSEERYRGRRIRPQTIRKEVATLQTVWNWATRQGLVGAVCPARGVTFPKGQDKPPFRTYDQIAAIVARGGLTDPQIRELWDGLFLDTDQVAEAIEFVRARSASRWLYPFLVVCAHTGARKSELLRTRVEDYDFAAGIVLVREKKRSRERETFRTVDMTLLVTRVMREYFASRHPGGPFAFAVRCDEPVSVGKAQKTFRRAFRTGKWQVLRGFHVFRHSFASNLAAAGVDPRVIDDLLGHQTEAMRKRYRHLFPAQRKRAVESVYGG
jgi:integrase